jgi:hypothetical protein
MTSLLAKSAKKAFSGPRFTTAVIQVTGYETNPEGGVKDQVMIGIDKGTGKEVRVTMADAPTEKSAAQRCTIAHLCMDQNMKVEVGGFVRADKFIAVDENNYTATFVKKLMRHESDQLRRFITAKVRVDTPRPYTSTSFGVERSGVKGKVQIMNEAALVSVSTGEELKRTIVKQLSGEIDNGLSHCGSKVAILRDSETVKTFAVGARKIKEGGVYRESTASEIFEQLKSNELVQQIAQGLDANKGEFSIDVIPGENHRILGDMATSFEYDNAANIFWHGNFNLTDLSTGEVKESGAQGWREGVIGIGRQEATKDAPWFVVSIAATFKDQLTLNGMEGSQSIRQHASQSNKFAAAPAQEARAPSAQASVAPQSIPVHEQSVPSYVVEPTLEKSSPALEDLFDEGMESFDDDDGKIEAAAEAYMRAGSASGMSM